MTPTFKQIRAFLSVARHLKFTRAAEELNISQPTLTVQINQLEEALAVKLFDRNKRQVQLTPAGHNLLPLFERLEADMEQVMAASTDLSHARRGFVRVAALPSVSVRLLPKALAAFKETHPHITVSVHDVVGDQVISMVKTEEVDFGVGIRLTPDRAIKVDYFVTDHICAFFQRGHELEDAAPTLSIADCARYPLILTGHDSTVRTLFERALSRDGTELEISAEANYMSTALGMVRAGLGVAILPMSATDAGNAIGLGFKKIEAPWLNRRLGIIHKAARGLSPVAQHFVNALYEASGSFPNADFLPAHR